MIRDDALDARHALLEDALDAVRQRHLGHRAALAGALKLDGYDTVLVDVDERDVAAVGLQARTDKLEHGSHIGFLYHGYSFFKMYKLRRQSYHSG